MMYLTIYESNIPTILDIWSKQGIDMEKTNVPNIFKCCVGDAWKVCKLFPHLKIRLCHGA